MIDLALSNRDKKFFLIIDELNRGNIPKIFGGLLTLLDYKNQNGIQLTYTKRKVSLPKNLHIIATMNTSDRSTANLDAALLRRFEPLDFGANSGITEGMLERYLKANYDNELLWIVKFLDYVNKLLLNAPFVDGVEIGPSFFLRDDLDDKKIQRIFDRNIVSHIEQQCYDPRARDVLRDLKKKFC